MKTKTTQLFIAVTIIAIIALLSYVYVSYYIFGLTKKTAEIKQDVSNMQITYQHAESLRQAISSATNQKDKIASYFLPSDGAIDFVSRIEKTAGSFGLNYATQDISQKSNDELSAQNKELLQVSFSARGPWASVMRLVKMVESLPYGIKIDRVNMAESAGAASSSAWSVDMAFSVVKIKNNEK